MKPVDPDYRTAEANRRELGDRRVEGVDRVKRRLHGTRNEGIERDNKIRAVVKYLAQSGCQLREWQRMLLDNNPIYASAP